jgi:hypothetical protein
VLILSGCFSNAQLLGYWVNRVERRRFNHDAIANSRSLPRSPAEIFCQLALPSTEPTAAEVTFVCSVLFDICRIPFFRRVGVMLMLHQLFVFRHFRITPRPFVAPAGWGHWRITARHGFKLPMLRKIKT